MNRPKILHIGGTLYWVLRTRNPDTQLLKDADSTPTVVVRKNGASTGDSVTITKRSSTTGIYDCSYNPASEIEGDEFTVEESAAVTGTTTGSATYTASWECTVVAIERGTNSANTIAPATPTNVSDVQTAVLAVLPTALVGGRIDASVGSMTAGAVAAIWDALTSGMSTAGSIGKRIVDYLTGDSFVRLGGPAGVSVSADIAAAKTVIDAAASSASTAATQSTAGALSAATAATQATTAATQATAGASSAATAATQATTAATQSTAAASSAAAVKVVTDKLATGIVQDGAVYQWTANALELAPAGGAGTGARTVNITVNDGTTVLENAIVRMTEGVNSFRALTNVSGVAVFNLDDATYTVSITKSGYSYAGTTIIVNGTETATYSMTAITITPGAGDLTTGWLVTRVAGVATEDITIRYQQRQEPASDTGSSYDDTIYSVDSDADGIVELSMVRGAYYYVWRGTGKRPELAQLLLIPANAGATYELPSHVGH